MNYQIDEEILTFFLPKTISHSLINDLDIKKFDCKYIIWDFKETDFITLPGAMYLICIGTYFLNKRRNNFLGCEIKNIDNQLIDILIQFGFFEFMVLQSRLIIIPDIIKREKRNRELKYSNKHFNNGKNVIMPLELIQIGNANHYETYIHKFFNHFLDFYISLSNVKELNFFYNYQSNYQKEYSEVSTAIFEMIKNIYDHSGSWGLGGIFASTKSGTQITFYDLGTGIFNSVNKNKTFDKELEAIKWALKDGNTSKPKVNQGHGFTVMKDFAEAKNGVLSIRSGRYHIYNNKTELVFNATPWFPGTQIVIFIPSKPNS